MKLKWMLGKPINPISLLVFFLTFPFSSINFDNK